MARIKSCGKERPKYKRETVKVIDDKPKRSYGEYLLAECLDRKLSDEECLKLGIKVKDGNEVWFYNDNKVPLCGEMGIMIIKNGAMVRTIPMGIH